ncbi:MazG nucleotide pyrophosphohydrolase domain-containing protein [Modestobacter sp. SYSU DS0875]
MRLDDYQDRIAAADDGDALTSVLGIGAHAGALLQAHSRYLQDALDFGASTALVVRELGDLLRHVSVMATVNSLSLDEIARANIAKIRHRAKDRRLPAAPTVPEGPVGANFYQELAAVTDEDAKDGVDPLTLGVPMLGLAGEAGTLLVAQKKAYRDRDPAATDPEFLAVELGDLLWYAATVARHSRIDLKDVLEDSAVRAEERHRERLALAELPAHLPILDEDYPDQERFPRRLVIRFQQQYVHGRAQVALTLLAAEPNVFPDGPVETGREGKAQGFDLPQSLGDALTDNSRRVDDYRFHDAIHLGFLAVMGWSPLMRMLLQLKRRSDSLTDENEDGARAIFAEEGMAAVLAKRAANSQGFLAERSVDEETVEMLRTVLEDLEVDRMPAWLWRRAITQGFSAMRSLALGPGGFLVVDLDARSLSYHKRPPAGIR